MAIEGINMRPTTTGLLGRQPAIPKPANLSGLGAQAPQAPLEPAAQAQPGPIAQAQPGPEVQQQVEQEIPGLSPEDKLQLDSTLTMGAKEVLAKVDPQFLPQIVANYGATEPSLIINLQDIITKFPSNDPLESVERLKTFLATAPESNQLDPTMTQQVSATAENVPNQGLGAATNVPPEAGPIA